MTQNRRMLLMLPVLALAAYLALFGDKTPDGESVGVARRAEQSAEGATPVAEAEDTAEDASGLLRVASRKNLVERAAQDSGIDLFSSRAANAPQENEQAAENLQQQAPSFPFNYIGKQYDGKRWQVFLDKGDATLVVAAGATIEGDFRVKAINPPNMQVVHVPTKHELSIHIDDAQ